MYNSKDFKSVLIYPLAFVVVEFLAILSIFIKKKLQDISGNHAATWWQKLAADILSLLSILNFIINGLGFSNVTTSITEVQGKGIIGKVW